MLSSCHLMLCHVTCRIMSCRVASCHVVACKERPQHFPRTHRSDSRSSHSPRTLTPLMFTQLTLIPLTVTPLTLTPLILMRPRSSVFHPRILAFRSPTHVFYFNFTCGIIRSYYSFKLMFIPFQCPPAAFDTSLAPLHTKRSC